MQCAVVYGRNNRHLWDCPRKKMRITNNSNNTTRFFILLFMKHTESSNKTVRYFSNQNVEKRVSFSSQTRVFRSSSFFLQRSSYLMLTSSEGASDINSSGGCTSNGSADYTHYKHMRKPQINRPHTTKHIHTGRREIKWTRKREAHSDAWFKAHQEQIIRTNERTSEWASEQWDEKKIQADKRESV